jgi:periplasmic divalent cation tolerance protein
MDNATGEILVITTVASLDQAKSLARSLLDNRLAACVTCLPGALSFFRWQSAQVSEEAEIVLLIKTHTGKLAELEEHFHTAHPYEVPEILVFEASAISHPYREWLHSELQITLEKEK